MARTKILALIYALFLCNTSAFAVLHLPADFPIPLEISKKVDFWEKIFLKYPSSSMLIHDIDHAELVLDVIDFKALAHKKKMVELPWRMKERIADSYLDRYALAINRFHKFGKAALKYGAIEERVWNIYSRSSTALEQLLNGQPKLRSQSGLSDVFVKAAYRAQFYLPYMEKIFQTHGVPAVVTRLPFVESMFDLNAKSKQGAYGIWQFMHLTAKQFLHVNRIIDERRSPFKATRAAAKYLKDGYAQLQSWPLTITSYNYGVNGMMKAVNTLNTRNIDLIVGNYKSPSFQYASKNFYAEFLAAVLVYNHLLGRGVISEPERATDIRSFTLNHRLSITELLSASEVSEEVFKKYNPCIKDIAFKHFRREKLPVPYEIFLPIKLANSAEKHLNRKYSMSIVTTYPPQGLSE